MDIPGTRGFLVTAAIPDTAVPAESQGILVFQVTQAIVV